MTSHTEHALTTSGPSGSVSSTTATPPGTGNIRLRERNALAPVRVRAVGFTDTPRGDTHRKRLWPPQANRILKFQRRWERIKADLPPQLSRKHIGMISIGGVIGTGLFVGSADALRNGGPIGAFLGYFVVGTMVYCLCVSVGEMIAFLPNVGGVVGLADLYVDPALGFSLGWAAWYNWTITLPTEITAAALVLGTWDKHSQQHVAWVSAIYLAVAIAINCFPSRVYGQMEYILSCMKVLTIVTIVLLSLIIDLGASSQGPIWFHNWKKPFVNYLDVPGAKGQFLGFWAVIMQASFSFFGSEVPGIAAGEVIDATRNVPRALRKVWIRITLFYLSGILCSGLLVPADTCELSTSTSAGKSPFIIAFRIAGWKVVPDVAAAAILISAWSAAASDIYIGSRFLFFLARRGHAPMWLSHLFRYPRHARERSTRLGNDSDTSHSDSETDTDSDTDSESGSQHRNAGLHGDELLGLPADLKRHTYVIPLASVLTSSSMGLLTFMSFGTKNADTVFQWLVSVASVASLQSWMGMLFTYIRWHSGTVHYEEKYKDQDTEEALTARAQIETIKKNRQWGQPYLAWYAFSLCVLVLLTNGWAVFVNNDWKIADTVSFDGTTPSNGTTSKTGTMSMSSCTTANGTIHFQDSEQTRKLSNPISLFLSAYIPLPFFVLLTFGYKLIKQTEMIPLDKMTFYQGEIPPYDFTDDEPKGRVERLLAWLMVI